MNCIKNDLENIEKEIKNMKNLSKDSRKDLKLKLEDLDKDILNNTITDKNIIRKIEKLKEDYIKNLINFDKSIKGIKTYFEEKHNIMLNDEQAETLIATEKNTLVTARAGSGKTRTIACRAIYAIEKENIKPEEILILAFNKDAAKEIRKRIREDFGCLKIYDKNIRTFHSLAYSLVLPAETILLDNEETAIRSEFEKFLETNVLPYLNEVDFKELYKCFYGAEAASEISNNFKFEKDYKKYRSNKQLFTLNGEKVKSNGEKYIADFLFEHDIKYQYEKVLTQQDSKIYRPDFTIFFENKTYIIEHWGINEKDPNRKVPDYWSKTWDEYKEEMKWKRDILNKREEIIIETCIDDLIDGRKQFEVILKERLERVGVKCEKLSKEKRLEKFKNNRSKQINKKLIAFIQKAKNYQKTPDEIDIELQKKSKNLSFYARGFIHLANEVYKIYEKELKRTGMTDFPNLLFSAAKKIKQGNYKIFLDDNKIQDLRKLKLILIDEFQDFSKPFYGIIKAIQKCNPDVKLFCVGDDWQAINGFAGSNLKFFRNYKKYFGDYVEKKLLLNYRSGLEIVNYGNQIMKRYYGKENCGPIGKAVNDSQESERDFIYINKTKYDNPITKKSDDYKYIFANQNQNSKEVFYFSIASRYLKECINKITKDMENKNFTYLILAREKQLDSFVNLEHEFKEKLREILVKCNKFSKEEFEKKFKVETIHKSKGAEADVVFLLNFEYENMKIHPDSEIDLIFGRTQQDIIDEEVKLYYVAVTRAKQKLYIINENKE